MSSFLTPLSLEWHYRSKDESLIAFSNQFIYSNALVTFPSAAQSPPALSHILIPHRPHIDRKSSSDEVNKVVELVLKHAKEHPSETLGVITMGIEHADRIDAALNKELSSHPELNEFFDETRSERFFVKNLERVQGDERDAIILSMGYGKKESGSMDYRLGPIGRRGGERRLNVAVTRARYRMTVVSSFSNYDMDDARCTSEGLKFLKGFLKYAANGSPALEEAGEASVPLNAFEEDVFNALEAKGIELIPQYGVSNYRIDMVAKHPERPGRLVLAIECDGASYHSSYTARDRDRIRQQHLEALGWRFHRIWSTDWFLRRDEEIERTLAAFKAAVEYADRADSTKDSAFHLVSHKEGRPFSKFVYSTSEKA